MTAHFVAGNVFMLGICVATVVLAGCKTIDNPKNNEDEVEKPREVECPSLVCTEYVTLTAQNLQDLADCYGWDDTTQSWGTEYHPAPPIGLFYSSPSLGGDCVPYTLYGCRYYAFPNINIIVDGTQSDCPCEEGEYGDPAPDGCCYSSFEMQTQFIEDSTAGNLEQVQIALDCGTPVIDVGSEFECTDYDPEVPEGGHLSEEDDDCATEETLSTTPDADYILEVDPSDSYVTVHTPGGEDTVPLTGMGVLDTGTTAFLTGIVDATETLNLVYNWSEWRLWFGGDIDFNFNSGSFVVPYSQGYHIKGAGKRNAGWRNITVEPTANATGAFNSGTGRWYVDYYDTFTGGWVEVHLEGDYYGISL